MSEVSKIAWTDSTFNPWIGCTKIGPGCDHCYAEMMDSRKRWDGGKTHWGAGVARYRTSASNWAQPLRWNETAKKNAEPHLVFCASLADFADNEVPEQWRIDLENLVARTRALSWLLVTKRIGNVSKLYQRWADNGFPDNVRLLITVCNQEEANRDIPKLLALPCKNGISYEPALGPIDFAPDCGNYEAWDYLRGQRQYADAPDLSGVGGGVVTECTRRIEWVIIGGESGSKARPFVLDWGKDTIRQCQAARVAVFFKQAGSLAINREGVSHPFLDRAGADPTEWPESLRIREFPQ